MSILSRFLSRAHLKPMGQIASRFLSVFEAHGIKRAQIPRWVHGIGYEDLQSDTKLLPALTPQVLDTTAQLFGLESAWLEGTSNLVLRPHGERGNSRALLDQIAAAVHASEAAGSGWNPAPLRVLTDTNTLSRDTPERQWLVLIIVQAIGDRGHGPAFRCQLHRHPFDWSQPDQRLELKAITWLVRNRFNTVVPLYQVQTENLDNILGGYEIPSVVLNRSIVTNPSLEDYIHDASTSCVAKEVDELPKLFAYLDASGLSNWRPEVPSPLSSRDDTPANQAPQEANPAPHAKPSATPGKRQAQEVHWAAILSAAQTIWAEQPSTAYAEVIRRLNAMPHLKAAAFTDSTIHKRLQPIAPPEVRGKPGRKPK